MIGTVLIAGDEWRLHSNEPNPEAIRAYADELETLYGRKAFSLSGEAMNEARQAQNVGRCRFLKEVSEELVSRFFEVRDSGRL